MNFFPSKKARAGKVISALGATLGVLLFSVSLFSQANFGRILGTVTDQSGGVMANKVRWNPWREADARRFPLSTLLGLSSPDLRRIFLDIGTDELETAFASVFLRAVAQPVPARKK